MSQLNEFIEKAKSDQAISEKLKALGVKGASLEDYAALATEYGFSIKTVELEEIEKNRELNENELEEVSGGGTENGPNCYFTPTGEKKYVYYAERIKCNSFCGYHAWTCHCWGIPDVCKDKWHLVETSGHVDYLAPYNKSNHSKKHPPNYNT